MTASYLHDGKSYLIARDCDHEQTLITMLTDMRFQPRNNANWFLETEEAIVFLLDAYPKLVEKYRVYGEKNLTRYKVRLSKPVIVAEVESKEEEKWFNLDLQVQYDDQRVPIEKIWKAWTQGKRYVQLKDGSYTSLPESWLEKLAHKLKALGYDTDKPPQNKFKQFEAPVLDKILEDLPEARTDSFWNTLRQKIHSFREIVPVRPPHGLHAELRPYQVQGLSYLNFLREYGFGGILADEMGLGKTVQTLSFILHNVERGVRGPNLIIVPTSVLPNWEREATKFVPDLKQLVIYGARRENMFKHIGESDLVITTYALLRRDLDELLKYEFATIILDEAQNIKNPNTITARSVRRLSGRTRLCLSGTPIENNLFELWSLFEFLMPGFLGGQNSFQRGIVKPIKDGDEETLDYLRGRVRPFILRRTKSEVAKDLPPKVENVYYCNLLDEQLELYAALAKKLKEQVLATVDEKGMAKSQMSILDALLKLRQICCHPAPAQTRPARSQHQPALGQVRRLQGPHHRLHRGRPQGAGVLAVRADAAHHPVLDDHQRDAVRLPGWFEQGPLRTGGPLQRRSLHQGVFDLAQGRRHRAQPHQRRLRHPLRPVVEPGRGKPGHRPHPPHRPAAPGLFLQDDLPEHGGGKDPEAPGTEKGRGRGHHPRSGRLQIPDPHRPGIAVRGLGTACRR